MWITAAFKFFFCSKFQLKKRKKQFLKNELKWLPLTVKWWNEVLFTIKLQHLIFMNDVPSMNLSTIKRKIVGNAENLCAMQPLLNNFNFKVLISANLLQVVA